MAVDPTVAVGQGADAITEVPRERLYDYYVRPADPQPSPLHALASALAPLSADLLSLAGSQQTKQNAKDTAEGKAAFWDANKDGAASATLTGAIPADANPHFMNGFASQAGSNDALAFGQSVGPHYDSLDKTTSDPKAFDNWFMPLAGGSANAKLKTNPYYAASYANGVKSLHDELSKKYITDRSEALKDGAQKEFSRGLGMSLTQAQPQGGITPDTNALAVTMETQREAAIGMGLDPKYVDKTMVDSIIAHAHSNKDPAILGVLDLLPGDPKDPTKGSLGQGGYGFAEKAQAVQTISNMRNQDVIRQRETDKYNDEQGSKDAQRQIAEHWSQGDINYIPTGDQMNAWQRTDPFAAGKMALIRENILKGSQPAEDPGKVTDFMTHLGVAGTPQDIIAARADGTITTTATLKSAYEVLNTAEKYKQSGGINRILDDQSAKRWIGTIEGLTANPKWVQNVVGSPRITQDGQSAINAFSLVLMKHSLDNPQEDPIARAQFIQRMGESVVKGISNQDSQDFSTHKFQLPPELAGALPQPGATAIPAAKPAQGTPPASPQQGAPQNAPAASPGAPATAPAQPSPTPGKQGAAQPQTQVAGNEPWRPQPPAGVVPNSVGLLQAQSALTALPAPPRFVDLSRFGVTQEVIHRISAEAASRGSTPQAILDTIFKNFHPEWNPPGAAPGKQGANDTGTPPVTPASFQLPAELQPHAQRLADALSSIRPEHVDNFMSTLRHTVLGYQDGESGAPTGSSSNAGVNPLADRGALSAQFESARAGDGAISYDGTGGNSYGRYQFAAGGSVANGSAVRSFISTLGQQAPDLAKKLTDAGGATAARQGTPQFKAAWKEAAADPRFRKAEDDAAYSELVGPAIQMTKQATGLDVNTRSEALQEVMWSTAAQHGGVGAAHLWQHALAGRDPSTMTDKELINALYDERSKVGIYFRSSTPQIQASVKNRFAEERTMALQHLAQEGDGTTQVAENN